MSGGLMSGGRMSGGRLSGGLKSYDRVLVYDGGRHIGLMSVRCSLHLLRSDLLLEAGVVCVQL